MKREYSKEELLNKAEAYCSAAERCISEVQKKITLWGGELYCNEILSRLISDKFIDETRFAKAFVRDKYRFNKWGSNKIVQALKLKRISSDDIQAGLSEIDNDNYDENIVSLIAAKRKSVKGKSEYECNAKIIRYALSKGYDMKSIMKHIKCDGIDENFSD